MTNNNKILSMKTGTSSLIFKYVLNNLIGFRYNNGATSKDYYYRKNIQGDIIQIFDEDGNEVGGYAYDAYGNHLIITDIDGIASINPFRYRGYYYDDETQLFYCNSRYYSTKFRRFL